MFSFCNLAELLELFTAVTLKFTSNFSNKDGYDRASVSRNRLEHRESWVSLFQLPPFKHMDVQHINRTALTTNPHKLYKADVACVCVVVLLGVLQQSGSVLGGRVVLGVAQPALSVVLHPVCPVAVAQQEEVGLLSSQQQTGSCNTQETFPPRGQEYDRAACCYRSLLLRSHLCSLPVQSRSS